MKLNANATFIKIPLAQIRETGNVRHEYDEDGIKELAESIRNNGLMNPITVKPAQEDENGEKTYELIAGHRRIRAYKYLCDQGDDFSMVECCIRTGNKLVLQIIENIQRADIPPREKEDAIAEMLAENYSQADIARELSKPIQWVSDIVAGAKVRKIADEAGLNTENIATKTLSQLRSIPDNELTSYLARLVAMGGTTRAATSLLNEWKNSSLRQISEYTESLPTTHESSSEESDIDEQIEGMFKDEADDIEYNDDESMIEPTVMTEAEWNYREERDRKESRFITGTEINKIGKRLFFKDLWIGRNFVLPVTYGKKQETKKFIVAQVTSFNGNHTQFDCYWWTDERDSKGHNMSGKTTIEDFLIDSEVDVNSHWWIYEIPDDAVAVKVPDMQPVKTEPTVMSEADFNASELADEALKPTTHKSCGYEADVDFEKDIKEMRFLVGTEIDKVGERLFFKNLWHSRYVVKKINGKNIVGSLSSYIISTSDIDRLNFFYRKTEDFSQKKDVELPISLIDSDDENYHIYAIPDDAVAIHVPDMHPTTHKSSNSETAQKGVKNPVSKKIEVRWQSFCRSKKIPEKEKTAFAFYEDLISFFENENQ